MRHERTILISAMAAALALAGAVVGGCDMSTASQSMSMGWVPRAEHDRALAEAKKQREEADRQRAEAQKWQAQAQQERQAGEAARTAKGAGPQQATEDLITRVQDQAQRLQGLQADLARVEQENKSLRDENRRLQAAAPVEALKPAAPVEALKPAAPVEAIRPAAPVDGGKTPAPAPVGGSNEPVFTLVVSPTSVPAQGAQKPAAAVIVTATTRPAPGPAAPAAGMTPAQRERQRLLDEAAKALREAKEALGDPLPGEGAEGTRGAQGGPGESPRGAGGLSAEGNAPAAATSRPGGGEGAEGTKGAQGGTGESPRGAGGSSSEGTAPAAAAANGPAAAGLAGDVTVVKGAQVTINLGSRNGLKKETRMYVHRGSQFIGVLQLTTVEAQSAQGIVDGRLSAAIGDQAVVFGE